MQRAIGLRRRAGVLHAAEDEVGYGDLRVARVRIGHADSPFERLDHLRRLAERTFPVVFAAREARNKRPGRRCAPPSPARPRRTVRRPSSSDTYCAASSWCSERRFVALVSALHAARRCRARTSPSDDDRRRRALLLGRIIEAREPIPRVLVLALRPEVGYFFGMLRRGLDKKQPGSGFDGAIGDGYCSALAWSNRHRQLDLELTVTCRNLEAGSTRRISRSTASSVKRETGSSSARTVSVHTPSSDSFSKSGVTCRSICSTATILSGP